MSNIKYNEIIVLIFLFFSPLAGQQLNQTNGPTGMSSLLEIPLLEFGGTLYYGSSLANIYKRGIISDSIWSRVEIVDPTYTNYGIYSITKLDTFIFVSADRIYRKGLNETQWTNITLPFLQIRRFMYGFGQILYGTDYGSNSIDSLFVSFDYGQSWKATAFHDFIDSTIHNRCSILSFSAINNNLLVGTTCGLFYTSDTGKTWNSAGLKGRDIREIITSGFYIFVRTYDGRLYRSSDMGSTWDEIFVEGLNYNHIRAIGIIGTRIFAYNQNFYGTSALFFSDDNGIHWQPIHFPYVIKKIYSYKDKLYVAGDFGIYVSSDFGQHFTDFSRGLLSASIRDLYLYENRIIAGTPSDLFYSDDHGMSWIKAYKGEITKIKNFKDTLFAAVDSLGLFDKIIFSTDSGKTWSIYFNFDSDISTIRDFYISDNLIFVSSDRGFIVANKQSGHYEFRNNGLPNPPPNLRAILVNGNYIFTKKLEGVFLSTDTGRTWINLTQNYDDLSNTVYGSTLMLVNNLVVTDGDETLYYSDNNGATWNKMFDKKDFGFNDINNIKYSIQNDTIFIISNPYIDYNDNKLELFFSPNFGSSWLHWTVTTNPKRNFNPTSIVSRGNVLYLGTGYSVWNLHLDYFLPIDDEQITRVGSEYHLYQNFPNPFNPITTIKFFVPESDYITLSIYNNIGQKITDLIKNKFCTAGTYSVQFNAGSLPAGIYYYKLLSKKSYISRKMLLIK